MEQFGSAQEAIDYALNQAEHSRRMAKIGLALSSEPRIERIFEMIVEEARSLTRADAGTLYIVNDERDFLDFVVLQNNTMGIRKGGASGDEIDLPPVPLRHPDGSPNHDNVSSYVALTGKHVNIPDVYNADGFDFQGTRAYDQATGYRSTSMLVMPMRNHEDEIIGVLQLLNAQDASGKVCAFSDQRLDLVGALASQAAVALTNVQLIRDLRELLYSFIKSIAAAIDAKSPYTKGHIDRVVKLTMLIAEAVNNRTEGRFADVAFSEQELEELRLAAWMHDVGKIVTPEHVVDKSRKLETIFDRAELIKTRFELIESTLRVEELTLVRDVDSEHAARVTREYERRRDLLREELNFILECNRPAEFMDDLRLERLRSIAAKTYVHNGEARPYLNKDEVDNLSVRKGTLTPAERAKIEDHVVVTRDMLQQLPFPRRLARVPAFASRHHERMDGSGYPDGLAGEELLLQARILAVADIFEALTAKDRPYKEPMKLSQALRILGFMTKDGHIDPDIHDLFVTGRVWKEYAESELDPSQVDV
ncbi:MAG: HD domain-containing phosphohydrolase [Desulfovibrionaceae bacterium]